MKLITTHKLHRFKVLNSKEDFENFSTPKLKPSKPQNLTRLKQQQQLQYTTTTTSAKLGQLKP